MPDRTPLPLIPVVSLQQLSTAELRHQIRGDNAAYRIGTPRVTDEEFDRKIIELRRRDPQAKELYDKGDPEMLSLDNYPFEDWLEKIRVTPSLVVQPKIDGCTLALRYVSGILTEAWNRKGKDLTALARQIPAIPSVIEQGGIFEVHGELYGIDKAHSQSDAAQAMRFTSLERKPTNKDPRTRRTLGFCAFRLYGATSNETIALGALAKLGFEVPDNLLCPAKQVRQVFEEWRDDKRFTKWQCDGIVVKVHDHATQQKLGQSDLCFNWALAIKH